MEDYYNLISYYLTIFLLFFVYIKDDLYFKILSSKNVLNLCCLII